MSETSFTSYLIAKFEDLFQRFAVGVYHNRVCIAIDDIQIHLNHARADMQDDVDRQEHIHRYRQMDIFFLLHKLRSEGSTFTDLLNHLFSVHQNLEGQAETKA